MKYLTMLNDRANLAILKCAALGVALLPPRMAHADLLGSMVNSVCGLVAPLVGKSKMVSLIFLIALAVTIFLWWMSAHQEDVIVWILRTGIALGVLINIFTLPTLLGLPPVCSGY